LSFCRLTIPHENGVPPTDHPLSSRHPDSYAILCSLLHLRPHAVQRVVHKVAPALLFLFSAPLVRYRECRLFPILYSFPLGVEREAGRASTRRIQHRISWPFLPDFLSPPSFSPLAAMEIGRLIHLTTLSHIRYLDVLRI